MNNTGQNISINNGTFFFDPEDRIYRDHFPSNPVVPGSLIVHAFLNCAREMGFAPEKVLINNFRFAKFVSPGEYSYTIEEYSGVLKCVLYDDSKPIVTGEIAL